MLYAKLVDGGEPVFPYGEAALRADACALRIGLPADLSEVDLSELRGVPADADPLPEPEEGEESPVPEWQYLHFVRIAEVDPPTGVLPPQEAYIEHVDGDWIMRWRDRAETPEQAAASLLAARATQWDRVKAIRDQAIDAGFEVADIGAFQSDLVSRTNITGAVTGAILAKQAAAPFAISWTLSDNSVAVLDADAMIAVGTTLMARVAATHAHAQQLRAEIDGAVTIAAVAEVNVLTGWPA